jgi:phosphoadenosine phosphosulfate reductase
MKIFILSNSCAHELNSINIDYVRIYSLYSFSVLLMSELYPYNTRKHVTAKSELMNEIVQTKSPTAAEIPNLDYSIRLLDDLTCDAERLLLSTSFGPSSAVLLKLVTDINPEIPVVWIDTGHNTASTYRVVEQLHSRLNLNLHIYHPRRSAAHRLAILGPVPSINDAKHSSFTEEIKLEPFRRALVEHSPHYWISGVRAQDNEHRRSMGVSSSGPFNTTKIAPLFYWSDEDMHSYVREHSLPDETHYFDPTKVIANRECGLHCRL